MNVHDGHRARVKRRFLEHGLDNFDEHTVLELLLFYALPQRDVNPLAHTLIDRFGSLANVLDAPPEELTKVPGVGENAAALINLIPQISRRYLMSRAEFDNILDSTQKAGEFIVPRFCGERDEVVYLVCMDAKYKVLCCRLLFRGSVNSASVSVRKVMEQALAAGSSNVILAHNHTSGIALPSREDLETTDRIRDALESVDIHLVDHIIVADDDFVSLADTGRL